MKGTIIIGPAESGKSRASMEMVLDYHKDNVVWVDGNCNAVTHELLQQCCNTNTELIYIEDAPGVGCLEVLMQYIPGGVHLACGANIFPEIIIEFLGTVKASDLPTFQSFTRRFDVIDFFNIT
ncbi:hypothetical protein [Flavobacterium sp.]|uniref:hypothetical protein n=1 Tax=Flavobacterium sp. TaxID=239 RepID=UPI00403394EC